MESGSAGEDEVERLGCSFTPVQTQANALLEVRPAPPTPPSSTC